MSKTVASDCKTGRVDFHHSRNYLCTLSGFCVTNSDICPYLFIRHKADLMEVTTVWVGVGSVKNSLT